MKSITAMKSTTSLKSNEIKFTGCNLVFEVGESGIQLQGESLKNVKKENKRDSKKRTFLDFADPNSNSTKNEFQSTFSFFQIEDQDKEKKSGNSLFQSLLQEVPSFDQKEKEKKQKRNSFSHTTGRCLSESALIVELPAILEPLEYFAETNFCQSLVYENFMTKQDFTSQMQIKFALQKEIKFLDLVHVCLRSLRAPTCQKLFHYPIDFEKLACVSQVLSQIVRTGIQKNPETFEFILVLPYSLAVLEFFCHWADCIFSKQVAYVDAVECLVYLQKRKFFPELKRFAQTYQIDSMNRFTKFF